MPVNSPIQKVGRRPRRPAWVTQEMLLGQEGKKKKTREGRNEGERQRQREELDTD